MRHALGRRWLRWTVPLAFTATAGAVLVGDARVAKAGIGRRRHRRRAVDLGSRLDRVRREEEERDDGRARARVQRPPRQPRGRRRTTSTGSSPAAPRTWRRRSRTSRRSTAASEATVFAGDNIGASPLANGLFFEEPITVATNLMNVDFGSVGNHEFDKGSAELLRIQNGGCRPVDGCTARSVRAARRRRPPTSIRAPTSSTCPPTSSSTRPARRSSRRTATKRFRTDGGKKFEVGFIGEVLKATPTIVTPTGVAGLTFEDEADAANAVVDELAKARASKRLRAGRSTRAATSRALRHSTGAPATSPAATSTRSPSGSTRRSR